jgi:hypothetical protein
MVMAGLVPAIHALFTVNYKENGDAATSAGMTRKGQTGG